METEIFTEGQAATSISYSHHWQGKRRQNNHLAQGVKCETRRAANRIWCKGKGGQGSAWEVRSPGNKKKLTKSWDHHDRHRGSGCLRFFDGWRDVPQISSTLLGRLGRPKSFYDDFWRFVSVENITSNIRSPTLGVTLSFMIPEGLKLDQKMNWR